MYQLPPWINYMVFISKRVFTKNWGETSYTFYNYYVYLPASSFYKINSIILAAVF